MKQDNHLNKKSTKKDSCGIQTDPIIYSHKDIGKYNNQSLFHFSPLIKNQNLYTPPSYYPAFKPLKPIIDSSINKVIVLSLQKPTDWRSLIKIKDIEVLFISPPWSSLWPNAGTTKFHQFTFEDFTNLHIPFTSMNDNTYIYIWTINKYLGKMSNYLENNGNYKLSTSITWTQLKNPSEKYKEYEQNKLSSMEINQLKEELINQIDDMYTNPIEIMTLLVFQKNPTKKRLEVSKMIISDYNINDPYKQPRIFVYDLIEEKVVSYLFDNVIRRVEIFSEKNIIRKGWLHFHYPLIEIEKNKND